ncbi:MAG TPA: hypothetical protein GX714_15270 [Chloroflexi bacterium]|jgi:hypothetical protein|nr:hypothetical protein [Chloroflexota bacterium]
MRARQLSIMMLLALVILGSAPAVALARSADPDNPELLRPNEARTGGLPGAPAGSFAFFAVDYPGGEQELVLRMTPRPADPSVANQIAFNVYGPDGPIGSSRTPDEGDPSVREFRYTASSPARLLIQVYNYTLNTTIDYTIVASGIAAAAPGPAETPPPSQEPQVLPETGPPTSGTIVGSLGGAFATITIPYPGDGSSVTVEATIAPDDPVLEKAVGLNVYTPDGHLIAQATSRSTPGRRQATFSSDVGGSYTVQIYNYTDGTPVSYTVSW